jgi:hypothetical protein
MDHWEIRTLKKSPSMCETIAEFHGDYAAAVNEARKSFSASGRRTAVVKDMYYWLTILPDGTEIDENTKGN